MNYMIVMLNEWRIAIKSLFPQNKLKDQVKEKVKWSISRDSMEAKQRELLKYMGPLKRDLKHQVST